MKIGLLAMSAKPYHAGHDGLVRLASQENDKVNLFVSTGDRSRTGEMMISGDTMQTIWWDYIEPTLPGNVIIDYSKVAPVTKIYETLELAEEKKSTDVYVIYSDTTDILKYTDNNLQKTAPTLFNNNQVLRRGVERSETVDVSGTEMRDLIVSGDIVGFISLLPMSIQKHGKDIFDMLVDDVVGESILKKYVKLILEKT